VTKFVVITSINEPNEAIAKFAKWKDWQTVVVGDRKTPEPWKCPGVRYLGIEEQYDLFGDFAHMIPENTYTRKMLGYAYAIKHGAEAIFESDDDNIPYSDTPALIQDLLDSNRREGDRYASDSGWVNIYKLFGAVKCWPRGFPLAFLKDKPKDGTGSNPWGIVQLLVDGEPDTDAIYRMTDGKAIYFMPDGQIILDEGTYCPVNSQATVWTKETFPLMFLPIGISDRVTDILRGLMATACLWQSGRSVAYYSPGVFQRRNAHNLHDDFVQEFFLYENSHYWSRLLLGPNSFPDALRRLVGVGAFHKINLQAYSLFLEAAGL
jgi:hypothetical protein